MHSYHDYNPCEGTQHFIPVDNFIRSLSLPTSVDNAVNKEVNTQSSFWSRIWIREKRGTIRRGREGRKNVQGNSCIENNTRSLLRNEINKETRCNSPHRRPKPKRAEIYPRTGTKCDSVFRSRANHSHMLSTDNTNYGTMCSYFNWSKRPHKYATDLFFCGCIGIRCSENFRHL